MQMNFKDKKSGQDKRIREENRQSKREWYASHYYNHQFLSSSNGIIVINMIIEIIGTFRLERANRRSRC